MRTELGAVLVIALAGCGRSGFVPLADAPPDGAPHTISIDITGNGAVTSAPAGLACFAACQASLSGSVTLTATPRDGWIVDHWSAPCGVGATCTVNADAALQVTFAPAPVTANLAFVTSTQVGGNFGGRTSGDSACATAAATAGLAGTFVSLLSTSAGGVLTPAIMASRGWVRTDGVVVADQPNDLVGNLWSPIDVAADGITQVNSFVWTGTAANGQVDGTLTCADWTDGSVGMNGEFGASTSLAAEALTDSSEACDAGSALYCVHVGAVTPVAPTPLAFGRYVFVTQAGFTPGAAGIAGADAICTQEATAAALPGSYRALLATSTRGARDRFNDLGGPWRRPDQVLVALDDLALVPIFDTAIATDATGVPLIAQVWVGVNSPGAGNPIRNAGTTATTCTDWMSTAGTGYVADNARAVTQGMYAGSTNSCSNALRVICAQE